MDRKELNRLVAEGPLRIRMNDGRSFEVKGREWISVSDIAAAVLHRDEEDGKWRHVYLPLVTMAAVEPLAPA